MLAKTAQQVDDVLFFVSFTFAHRQQLFPKYRGWCAPTLFGSLLNPEKRVNCPYEAKFAHNV